MVTALMTQNQCDDLLMWSLVNMESVQLNRRNGTSIIRWEERFSILSRGKMMRQNTPEVI